MAVTKSVQTLERARDAFEDIKEKLEEKSGGTLDDVHVENYPGLIDGLYKGITVSGKTLIFSN